MLWHYTIDRDPKDKSLATMKAAVEMDPKREPITCEITPTSSGTSTRKLSSSGEPQKAQSDITTRLDELAIMTSDDPKLGTVTSVDLGGLVLNWSLPDELSPGRYFLSIGIDIPAMLGFGLGFISNLIVDRVLLDIGPEARIVGRLVRRIFRTSGNVSWHYGMRRTQRSSSVNSPGDYQAEFAVLPDRELAFHTVGLECLLELDSFIRPFRPSVTFGTLTLQLEEKWQPVLSFPDPQRQLTSVDPWLSPFSLSGTTYRLLNPSWITTQYETRITLSPIG